jgi:hypothetical protein
MIRPSLYQQSNAHPVRILTPFLMGISVCYGLSFLDIPHTTCYTPTPWI